MANTISRTAKSSPGRSKIRRTFDEKIGGTFHFALGAGYPETGSKNESGLHWDMLCDMSESDIRVDGEVFYRDGKPVV